MAMVPKSRREAEHRAAVALTETAERFGTLGRVRREAYREDPKSRAFPLESLLFRVRTLAAAGPPPARRTWRLLRAWQLNQGNTPWCVAATGKHWEKAAPTSSRAGGSGLTMDALYAELKKVDGYPGQDGSDGNALAKVYRGLGMVGAWHWHFHGDNEAHLQEWLLTRGSAAWGAYWSESMMSPGAGGLLTVAGDFRYGHETLLIGYDRATDTYEGVQSWYPEWGDRGRFRLPGAGFRALMEDGGDVVAMVETPRLVTA